MERIFFWINFLLGRKKHTQKEKERKKKKEKEKKKEKKEKKEKKKRKRKRENSKARKGQFITPLLFFLLKLVQCLITALDTAWRNSLSWKTYPHTSPIRFPHNLWAARA